MAMQKQKERFWEIDLLKGVAFLGMAVYHTYFFFDFFFSTHFFSGLQGEILEVIGQIVRILFLGSAGILLGLSEERRRREGITFSSFLAARWKRALQLLIGGIFLSLLSFIFFPQNPILFGVLHCIGGSLFLLSTIAFSFFFLWTGAIFIFLLTLLKDVVVLVPMPAFIGLMTGLHIPDISMMDYFPLFPWLGVITLGTILGKILYPKGERRFPLKSIPNGKVFLVLEFFGKNSLFWYFAHIFLLGILGGFFLKIYPN